MLGWNKEVQQAAQGISLIPTLDDLEKLAQKSRGSGLKGRVEHREKVLDGTLETVQVLETHKNTKDYFKIFTTEIQT